MGAVINSEISSRPLALFVALHIHIDALLREGLGLFPVEDAICAMTFDSWGITHEKTESPSSREQFVTKELRSQ